MVDHERVIDGKAFAAGVRAQVARGVANLRERHGLVPGLAVVLVGEDPASAIYVRNKIKATRDVGMESLDTRLPADTTQDTLLALLDRLNADERVHGILVQMPLPPQIDQTAVIDAIDPAKDVDGFHPINVGRLATGTPVLVPCTPLGCMLLLRDRLGDLSGKRALVIGRSNIVGKPMAALLLQANCTVTMAHSRTRDLADECRRADIVVAAVGRAELVRGDWVRPGATVIDVGQNQILGPDGKPKLVGDVAFAEVVGVAAGITPVPGGVGPMTIACLLQNTLTAACRRHGIAPT